jgi:hypothetical protein
MGRLACTNGAGQRALRGAKIETLSGPVKAPQWFSRFCFTFFLYWGPPLGPLKLPDGALMGSRKAPMGSPKGPDGAPQASRWGPLRALMGLHNGPGEALKAPKDPLRVVVGPHKSPNGGP